MRMPEWCVLLEVCFMFTYLYNIFTIKTFTGYNKLQNIDDQAKIMSQTGSRVVDSEVKFPAKQ